MKYSETIVSSIKSILSHKLRSFLTLAGIMIGVAAVTTMFSSVEAMKKLIEDTISSLGYDNVIILYSKFPDTSEDELKKYKSVKRFKQINFNDFFALKNNLEHIEYIYPTVDDQRNTIINGKKSQIRIKGVENIFFDEKGYIIAEGRKFNVIETENGENVCVLGKTLSSKLFRDESAVGKFISIGDVRLKVIGILDFEEKQSNFAKGNEWERRLALESCYVPTYFSSKYLRPTMNIDVIWIKATDAQLVGDVYNSAVQILRARHNMADDVGMRDISKDMLEVRQQIQEFLKNWNIILLAISSISLFTGGIGLFSILLISITERMKEIGIRKSVGAKNRDIFSYFLIESIMLALIGGIVGSGFALILINILTKALKVTTAFPYLGIIVGLIFAIVVGLISGFYPAYKASKIDPIQAIFYTE
ncbi:MAG TPA: FtsX-like permease family protein [Candidatus Cloacimonetes bacterium]|nr:FtsX-like permease family protein [Candidatus Cloacimonadota bacterium]HEX37352.1 FtsX-like permease family protein [Candidatus Cloacimonadota bacterium]